MLRIRYVNPRSRIRFFSPRLQGWQDPGTKKWSNVVLIPQTETKFSKIRKGMFIPDPVSYFSIPESGYRGQKSTGSRIRNAEKYLNVFVSVAS